MSAISFPARLDPLKWAEQESSWSGHVPLSRFRRLWAEAAQPEESDQVQVSCRFFLDERHLIRLVANVQVSLPLMCQRCLQPVRDLLALDLDLIILQDGRQMDRVEEDADVVVLDEEQLAHGHTGDQQLGLLDLLEDELLLALPMSPRHSDCQVRQHQAGPVIAPEPRANPFEVLAQLKQNTKPS